MKRIISLAVILAFVFLLAACGKDERGNTVSGPAVDSNTVEIVENAYKTTESALKEAKALEVQSTVVETTTVDGSDLSERVTSELSFINSDSGKLYAIVTEVKSGDIADEMQLYSDGKDTYGARAGKTYILSKDKDTDAYVDEVLSSVKLAKIDGIKVINTTVVDTSTGGHGFVLEYDCSSADIKKIFEGYFSGNSAGVELKFTKLTSSGIIDSKGRLTAQTISLEYTYDLTVSAPAESTSSDTSSKKTDSDNKTSSESTSSVATETQIKTVTAKLTVDNVFNYELETVKVPDLIEIGKDADGNDIKHDEISIQDFTGLAAGSSDKEEEKK